ncbi:MAG: hypothetical protein AB3N14_19390 [Flavobacteriaceae bacterium]
MKTLQVQAIHHTGHLYDPIKPDLSHPYEGTSPDAYPGIAPSLLYPETTVHCHPRGTLPSSTDYKSNRWVWTVSERYGTPTTYIVNPDDTQAWIIPTQLLIR